MGNEEKKPKIIADDDWKVQAKKEKEKLGEKEQQKNHAAQPDNAQKVGPMEQLPPANFMVLINSLALQALLYMGRLSDKLGEKDQSMVNMDLAKHHIDLIQVLEDKTKGNLTDNENKALAMTLHELRMQYVQTMSQ